MANKYHNKNDGHSFHPTYCNLCAATVDLVSKKVIYESASKNDLVYLCTSCGAYVGCKSGTRIAAGSLANEVIRLARREAHAALSELVKSGRMNKSEAYLWMQHLLNLPLNRRGIGWLDEKECRQLTKEINIILTNGRADSAKRGIANLRAMLRKNSAHETVEKTECSQNQPSLEMKILRFEHMF